jgi:phosphoribosylglycinamide formyltransferase-1
MRPRIAILASGGGTTAEALIRAAQRNEVTFEVGLVITSRQDTGIIERIASLNHEYGLQIACILLNNKTHPLAKGEVARRGYQTAAEEAAMFQLLHEGDFDLIACLGYMKHAGPSIVSAYGWRSDYSSIYQAMMLNTHPGILPDTAAFYGENIQKYVLEKGLPYGGHTVHLVSEEYDAGPIIAEHKVPVEPGDTSETLFERVQATEKKFLPEDIGAFIAGRQAYLLVEHH